MITIANMEENTTVPITVAAKTGSSDGRPVCIPAGDSNRQIIGAKAPITASMSNRSNVLLTTIKSDPKSTLFDCIR
jgi:hypothetical protein